jgi:carbon-monoxide dehydrogenase small subunit
MSADLPIKLTINGARVKADVEPRLSLLDFLRDHLKLTGTKAGCEHGVCGACTVLLDGEPVRACLMLAVQATGQAITTIEGEAEESGRLNVIQDAFCETHALQCGYCTSGMILTARALLQREPNPSRVEIRDAISANLCRCTGYQQIIEAIELAAKTLLQSKAKDAERS